MTPVIFSDSQGMGYVSSAAVLPEGFIRDRGEAVNIAGGTLYPGTDSDLMGFFSRPLRYLGIHKENEMIFYIGSTADLFGEVHFWQRMIYCSRTRIFSMYSNNAGRDWNWVNNQWK